MHNKTSTAAPPVSGGRVPRYVASTVSTVVPSLGGSHCQPAVPVQGVTKSELDIEDFGQDYLLSCTLVVSDEERSVHEEQTNEQ